MKVPWNTRASPRTASNAGLIEDVSKASSSKKRAGYTTANYRESVAYACRGVAVPRWHLNQLRHTAGTNLRKLYGIEAASIVLGHSNLTTTEIYVEMNAAAAKEIAKRAG